VTGAGEETIAMTAPTSFAEPLRAPIGSRRAKVLKLQALLAAEPALRSRFEHAREQVRLFQNASYFEIAQNCNLRCEGCFYFEGGHDTPAVEEPDLDAWSRLFAQEAARGVTMGYFVGAEPALAQERLLAASRHIPYGNVGTNGTIRIHPDVPYRIQISVWGTGATDALVRGASVFRKGLANYAGDRRALVLYTFHSKNIEQAREVARLCAEHGLPLTFNLYSPTHRYLAKLAAGTRNDDRFFRISSPSDNLMLDAAMLAEVADLCDALTDEYPGTVLYDKAFNRFVAGPRPPHAIDGATGIAEGCGSRIRGTLHYFTGDLRRADLKCCTPDIDCSQCRIYSGAWSSLLEPREEDLASPQALRGWLAMTDTLARIFVSEPVLAPWAATPEPA
jgi:hypothetical protein